MIVEIRRFQRRRPVSLKTPKWYSSQGHESIRRHAEVAYVAQSDGARSLADEQHALDRLDLRRRNRAFVAQRNDLLPDVDLQSLVHEIGERRILQHARLLIDRRVAERE